MPHNFNTQWAHTRGVLVWSYYDSDGTPAKYCNMRSCKMLLESGRRVLNWVQGLSAPKLLKVPRGLWEVYDAPKIPGAYLQELSMETGLLASMPNT